MPIAFSKLKKYGVKMAVLPGNPDEGTQDRKFITDQRFLIPADVVSGIPMEIETVKLLSLGRLLPKYYEDNHGYLRYESFGVTRHTRKPSGDMEHIDVFQQDVIRSEDSPPPLMMGLNPEYVKLFGITEFYKHPGNHFVEFKIDTKNLGVLMPMAGWAVTKDTSSAGYTYTDEEVALTLFESAIKRIKIVPEEAKPSDDILKYQKDIADLRRELQYKNDVEREQADRMLRMQGEIDELRKAKASAVCESLQWPQPLLKHPITGKTMEDCKVADFKINSVDVLHPYLRKHMPIEKEVFMCIYLDNSNAVMGTEYISVGCEDQTAVYPRSLVKSCLAANATAVIVSHNHPTGKLRPSQADLDITKSIQKALEAVDIRFLDHMIVGAEGPGYFSFRENGLIR